MNEDVLNFLTDSANSIREQLDETEQYYLKDFGGLIKKIPKGVIVVDGNEPVKNRIKDRVYFVKYVSNNREIYKFEDYLGNELSLSLKDEEEKLLDIETLNCLNGGLRTTDGSEVDSNYYVRSGYISYDNNCCYTVTCPIKKCVYCFLYDENKKYVSYSKKQEGTYVYRVPRGYYVRFLFKYTNNTVSSGTVITSPSDFLSDFVITRTEKELDINTNDNIYFYVDGDDGSRVPCVLRLPSTYKSSGKAIQLVMCAHGAGGTIVPSTDTNQLTTWLGYVDNGYAIFDVHGASATISKHWGNEEALHVYYRAYKYILENYNVEEQLVISGKSMGGLTAINFANYYPNICRCVAVLYPVTDLYNQININNEMINNGNTSSMLKAYGITSWTDGNTLPDKMVGYDPLYSRMVGEGILLQIPLKIWHGTADTYVDYSKSELFISKIKKVGGHADYVPIEGIYHGNYDKNKVPLSNSDNATGVVYDNYWKTEVVEKELIPWVDNFTGKNNKKSPKIPLEITSQPQSVNSAVGNEVSFSISSTGTGTLTYQWQISKDGGITWTDTNINGSKTNFIGFIIPNSEYEGRMFRCVVTDSNGNSIISDTATLTLNGTSNITITSQPQDISAKVNEAITISVAAESSKSKTLAYQWQVSSSNGVNWGNTSIAGNTTSTLSFSVPGINYNGRQYRCKITDGNGNWVLSNAMTLTVTE